MMNRKQLKTEFGKVVKGRRKALQLSQVALADVSGLHRTYISDVEGGRRNLSLLTMVQLARALEVSPAIFFAGVEFDPSNLPAKAVRPSR